MEGSLISQNYFKKDQQLNTKQAFSTESKKQDWNLKQTGNITYMREVASPQ